MSNEIRFTLTASVAKGNLSRAFSAAIVENMTGTLMEGPKSMALTTSFAAIGKGSVGTAKWLYIRNLHATVVAVVSLDAGSTDHFTLATTDFVLVPLAAGYTITNCHIKSVTNPGEVEYAVVEA